MFTWPSERGGDKKKQKMSLKSGENENLGGGEKQNILELIQILRITKKSFQYFNQLEKKNNLILFSVKKINFSS